MARKEIKAIFNDNELNKMNSNFKELYDEFGNVVETVSTKAYDQVVDAAKLNWKDPVDYVENLPSNASEGDARMVRDNGVVYRYDGSAWKDIQEIDVGPVNEVDTRLTSQLIDIVQVNIKNYEDLVVDGDWREAFQQALSDGDKVYVPKGVYNASTIEIPSNKEIVGDGDSTVFFPLSEKLFEVTGRVEKEIRLIDSMVKPSKILSIEDAKELKQNDYVLIKSQRDCLDEIDSRSSWTLGNRTSDRHSLHFGEFLQIEETSENSITLLSKPIYHNYLKDKTAERSEKAREFSTVQKIIFAENIKLKDFLIKKTTKSTIKFLYGINCLAENVKIYDYDYMSGGEVNFITFENSLDCEAVNCVHVFVNKNTPDNFYGTNIFKIKSSQNCGFDGCTSKHGGQPFDITYSNGSIPSTNCYVTNCEVKRSFATGIATHGGVFQTKITDNRIHSYSQGINNRSRSSIITDNLITGGEDKAIFLYDKWAKDCIVSNNTIVGFHSGVVIQDSSAHFFEWVGGVISNNTIKDCEYGVIYNKSGSNKYFGLNGIIIADNVIETSDVNSVGISMPLYSKGVNVLSNLVINRENKGSHGVFFGNNSDASNISNNTIMNFGTGIRLGQVTDAETVGDTITKHVVKNNNYDENTVNEDFFDRAYINLNDRVSSLEIKPALRASDVSNNSLFYSEAFDTLYFKDKNGGNNALFKLNE